MTFRRFTTFVAGILALTGGLCVHASDEEKCSSDPPRAPALRIAIDPRTGALAAATAVPAAPSTAVQRLPLAGVRLPSGAVRVDLKGRCRMAVVAHKEAAGAITTACVPADAPKAPSHEEVTRAE